MNTNSTKTPVSGILGVITGIVMVIIGISRSDVLKYASFEGDFYTYAYKGFMEVSESLGMLISVIGVAVIVISAQYISGYRQNDEMIAALKSSQGNAASQLPPM